MSPYEQSGPTQQSRETVGQIKDEARAKMDDVVQQARETATGAVGTQKGRAAESVSGLAQALRQTGQQLEQNNQGTFVNAIDRAANRLERFSDDLEHKSVDELLTDVQGFARRDPQLFLGGAVVLGLLAARFLKSSAARPMSTQQSYPSGSYGTTGYSTPYGSQNVGQGAPQYRRGSRQYDYPGTYSEGEYSTTDPSVRTSPYTGSPGREDE